MNHLAAGASTQSRARRSSRVCIYALLDPRTGQTKYIGKATHVLGRLRRHIASTHRTNVAMALWLSELSDLGLRPSLEICEYVDEAEWKVAERKRIALFWQLGRGLLNLHQGGQGGVYTDHHRAAIARANTGARHHQFGRPLSPETKIKISDALRGKKNGFFGRTHSEDARRKIREARARQTNVSHPRWTPEQRKRLSLAMQGQKRGPLSSEHRAKIAAAKLGRKRGPMSDDQKIKISLAVRLAKSGEVSA